MNSSGMAKTRRAAVGLMALALALAGCPGALVPPNEPGFPAIAGSLTFAPDGPSVQATMAEVANAATVSLIDPQSGQTVATSITNPDKTFRLTFSNSFQPGPSPYVLEAVKGLSVGGTPNRAGASAARIRTLIQWKDESWKSVSANQITVSQTTTALSIIASLRSADVSRPALIDALTMDTPDASIAPATPDTFAPGTSNVTNAEFHRVYELVSHALTMDQDPVEGIYRDANGAYQRLTAGSSISRVSPPQAAAGTPVTIHGQNFATPANANVVTFAGGVTAVPTAVSSDRTKLTVTVPAGAGSGPVAVRAVSGTLTVSGGYMRLANAPLAGTRFIGVNAGTWNLVNKDFGPFARIIATQPNTTVTLHMLLESGGVDHSQTRQLLSAGSAWDVGMQADRISMFQILSDKPVLASYDTMDYDPSNVGHGSDDEWAVQTGTDYYFRIPGTYGDFRIISHASSNPVTVTCLTSAALNIPVQTLQEGDVISRSAAPPNTSRSFWYRVQSTHPTTAVYGVFSDNASTPIFSADMKTFYAAFPTTALTASYQLVGHEDGTSVTVTDLTSGNSDVYTLNAGQHAAKNVNNIGTVKYRVVADKPLGFYVNDKLYSYENSSYGSVDVPGSVGKQYRIVSPSRAATNIYLLSLAPGNTVTLSGGLNQTVELSELQWKNVGALPANTVLTITGTQPVAVLSADSGTTEFNYSLIPY
ncbi:IPT/TIG domain protein [compost metagenome]